jgi:hypothetical protein
MEGTARHPRPARRRRRASLVLAGALAVTGLALSASAFGGRGALSHAPKGSFCHVVRDCVYPGAPDTRIESGPLGVTDNPRPTFEFTSNVRPVSYECRLDGSPFHTCQNPYTSYHLSDGEHRIDVRAVAKHHNADPTPASLEFRVDTRCPGTEILHHPGHVINGDDASFTFGSSGHGHVGFASWLDGRRLRGQHGSHLKLHNLKRGAHVLGVKAVDAAGNTDSTAARFKFRVGHKSHRHGHRHGHGSHHPR